MNPHDPESVYRGKPSVAMPLFEESGLSNLPPEQMLARAEVNIKFAGERADSADEALDIRPFSSSCTAKTSPAIQAHARRTDPATSHAAARSVRGITKTQRNILAIFLFYGPATDEFIGRKYGQFGYLPKASPSGLRSRRAELVRLNLVRDSGRTAKISTGRMATVWELVK